jgi:hypothetical protein
MKPSDNPCAGGGESFLYVLDYQCRPFPEGLDPLSLITDYSIQRFHVGQGAESRISGERLSLGLGIASQPVLSTAGDRLFIQMSGGEIFSQRVRIPPPKMKGWSER